MIPDWRRHLSLLCIIFAGEAIFSLPFHIPRFFKPTVLQAFDISNTALGDAFAVYGLTAMLSYLPGGWLADRYSARHLMATSLLATAAGGLYLASFPDAAGLRWLYAWWGMTTILLFWAAMIRATREWGGGARQGRAFGLLEGGRGLMAAASAAIAVGLLAQGLTGAVPDAASRVSALREVIFFYCGVTALAALLCAWAIPQPRADQKTDETAVSRASALGLGLQAAVVVSAYCAYKGLDNYALYAVSAFGMNEVEAARFMAGAAWLRPVAAVAAGVMADRVRASTALTVIFLLALITALIAATATSASVTVLMANLLCSVAAVYALRGVYFALTAEVGVPESRTGVAVGLVSVLGFTPDIFIAPLTGRLLDAYPGLPGLQRYFGLLAAFALFGMAVSLVLAWRLRRRLPRAA